MTQMLRIVEAANTLTWPGAFAIVGVAVCVTVVVCGAIFVAWRIWEAL